MIESTLYYSVKMKQRFILLSLLLSFILLVIFNSVFAQELTVSASKTKLAVGEQFQITYSLNTSGNGFRHPSFNDFEVYSGPNQSTSMQIINGAMSQSVSYSFILAPRKEGTYTIIPASITVNGKKIESKSLTINVLKGGNNNQQQQNSGNQQRQSQQQKSGTEELGNNLFIKASVDKSKVYVGEQLVVTYKVYTRVSIVDNGLTKAPVFNGFWSEDVFSPNKQATLHPEVIDGIQYQVAEIKKTILIPQHSGTLNIDAMEMDCVIRMSVKSNNFFDQFFGGGYRDSKVSIKSRTLQIEVMPLPVAGKPDGFSGAVGEFSIETKVNKNKLKTNDGVNYLLTLSGKGNIKFIEPIKLDLPKEFESFDPKMNDKISVSNAGISGSRTYDYLLIPRVAGNLEIPALHFSYFDPQKNEYIILKSAEIPIEVEQGEGEKATVTNNSNISKEDVKMLGSDIRYIKSKTELERKGHFFFDSYLFYFLLILPLIGLVVFLLLRKRFEKENKDVVLMRSKKATKLAQKRLQMANSYLSKNAYDPFYEELYKALYGYLSDKLNINGMELSKDIIIDNLRKNGANEDTLKQLHEILSTCEFARYSPVKEVMGMKSDYDKSIHIISEIEETLRS
jgi:hypothetical protein